MDTRISCPANIDAPVITDENGFTGKNAQLRQTELEWFKVGFGWHTTFSGNNDNLKKPFELWEQGQAVVAGAFLPLGIGNQGQTILP